MHWLFLSIVLDFGFVQFFKLGQRRGYDAPIVVTANYLTVAVTIGAYLLITDSWHFPDGAIQTGLVTGVLFISSMLLMNFALTIAPVGAVLSAFRIAIIVPVFFGVYLWGESLVSTQAIGLLLALLALVLMTPRSETGSRFTGMRAFALLGMICIWQGLSHTSLRSVHYKGLDEAFLQVLMVTGTTAGLIGVFFILLKKGRPTRPAVKLGVLIGAYNAVALCVILTALSELPGTLLFPVMGCSVVLLDNMFAHFYWHEPLNRPAMAGVAVAILSLALVV
jgi:drug/metabolite transporter (DMT)-like permease